MSNEKDPSLIPGGGFPTPPKPAGSYGVAPPGNGVPNSSGAPGPPSYGSLPQYSGAGAQYPGQNLQQQQFVYYPQMSYPQMVQTQQGLMYAHQYQQAMMAAAASMGPPPSYDAATSSNSSNQRSSGTPPTSQQQQIQIQQQQALQQHQALQQQQVLNAYAYQQYAEYQQQMQAGYPSYQYPALYPTTGGYPYGMAPLPPNMAVVMPDGFDRMARFDGVARPSIPPPPPGVAPNMAQLAMMHPGQNNQVVVGQKKSKFF